jgi:hypothetical protein
MFRRLKDKFISSPTLLNWAFQLSSFIHGIFITSIILVKFSNLEYSFWMLLKTLVAFGLLAEAGLGRTVERSVAFFYAGASRLPRNRKDYEELEEESGDPNIPQLAGLLYTIKFIYLILSGATIAILASAGIAILWNLFTQSNHDRNLWIAFGLMILQASLMLQSLKWRSFMTGTRHLTELYRLNTVVSIVRIFGFLALLLSGFRIVALMSYLVAEYVFVYTYMRRFMEKWFLKNDYRLKRSFRMDRGIFSSLWSVSWKTGLNTWGYFFTNRGVELITSQLKDTALMAGFLFTNTILRFIKNVAQTPITVKYPEIFGYMSSKYFGDVRRVAAPRIFLSMAIMVVGFTAFGVLGNWLLDLIGAEDKSLVPASIFILICVYLLFESHALIHGTIYISTNAVPFLIPALITGAATYLVGSLILPKYGLLGLMILQVGLNFGNNFWYSTYLSLKLVQWPFFRYIRDISLGGIKYWVKRAPQLLNH